MNNRSMPFYEENIVKLYTLQMHRKWKFKSKYESIISESVKILIKHLLDPQPTTRISIEDVLASTWFQENTDPEQVTSTRHSISSKQSFKPHFYYDNKKDIKKRKSNECYMIKEITEINRSGTSIAEDEPETAVAVTEKKDEKQGCCVII